MDLGEDIAEKHLVALLNKELLLVNKKVNLKIDKTYGQKMPV